VSRLRSSLLNIFSLAAVQGANALLPLLIYPLVLIRLGPERYGTIVQGEALSLMLSALVLYGFEVTGVAAVVRIKEHQREQLSDLLSAILTTRLLLLILGVPVIVGVAALMNPDLALPTLAWCLVPLSFAVSPNYMLQALRDNIPLAVINVVSRAAAVLGVILTVTGPDRFLFVPLIIGSAYSLAALTALLVTARRYRLSFSWVGWPRIFDLLKSGRDVFLGNAGAILYRDSYLIILGLVGAPSGTIATFSIAEKLTKAFQALVRPLNQHFFPRAMSLAQGTLPQPDKLRAMLRLSAMQQAALVGLGLVFLIGYWLFGGMLPLGADAEQLNTAIMLFFVMAFATLFGVANYMLGIAGLNAMGRTRYVLYCQLGTGIACVLLGFALISQWGALGAAAMFVTGEMLLFALFALGYMRRTLAPTPSARHPERP